MIQKLSINNIQRALLIAAGTSVLLIQGCKKKEPVQPPAPVVKTAVVAGKQTESPVQKQSSSSSKLKPALVNQFDFGNKKDPFKPFVTIKKVRASGGARVRNYENALPIHRFDVNQFKMIGIITGAKGNRAMVVDPNGKSYVIKVGMTIGKNGGRVMAVTSRGIDVLEQFRDDNGKLRKENIRIALPRKQ